MNIHFPHKNVNTNHRASNYNYVGRERWLAKRGSGYQGWKEQDWLFHSEIHQVLLAS